MTQAPPPYGGYPGHQPLPPAKKRPSGWWFVLGGGLVGAAVVAGIVLFIWTLVSFLDTDATVPADGETHVVSVATDGDRLLWHEDGIDQDCQIVDQETGRPVDVRNVSGTYSRSGSDGSFHGRAKFDPGSGVLEVTCQGGGEVLIGPAPQFESLVTGILLTVLVPLGLGLAGVAILLVTGILWATRPRQA